MKRLITTIVLSTSLAAGPAMADHEGGNLLSKENVGGAIGAAVGGLAGNKIVEGDGQSAATAAGAVGGWLLGKNIAHNYRGGRHRSYGRNHYRDSRRDYRRDHRRIPLHPIRDTFVAKTTSNVRSGPGTRFSITDRLHRWEHVHVVGKVKRRNWFMVRKHGRRGFVYAPLLRPARHGYRGRSARDEYRDHYRRGSAGSGWHP